MSIPNDNSPLARLRHHVTGAIERGEATPIVGQPSPGAVEQALAQEKANQEKIGATMQAARASATQPQGNYLAESYEKGWKAGNKAALYGRFTNEEVHSTLKQKDDEIRALQAQRDELRAILERFYAQTYGKSDLVAPLDFEQARAAIARVTEGGTGQ